MSDVSSHRLRELIDATLEANGWTAAEVARRAQLQGCNLTKSDVSDYRRKLRPTIVASKVEALAAGLDLRPYRVALAWLEDLGIVIPLDVRSPEDALSHDHTLPANVRSGLLAQLRAVRA